MSEDENDLFVCNFLPVFEIRTWIFHAPWQLSRNLNDLVQ